MKYLTIIICFATLLIFFNSCKKNNTVKNTGNSTSIIGAWELESAYGGTPLVHYPSGNGNIIEFTDSIYKKYANGNLIKSGYYTITRDTSVREAVGILVAPGQFTDRMIFDNDTVSNKTFIDISDNKLTFLSGFFPFDGGSSVSYERKQN